MRVLLDSLTTLAAATNTVGLQTTSPLHRHAQSAERVVWAWTHSTGPSERYPPAYPPSELPAAASYKTGPTPTGPPHLMTSPPPSLLDRKSSDERWQRYEHTSALPPAISPNFSAPSGREALSHRGAALVPPPVAAQPKPPASATAADPDPPRARVACSFCRVRKLRCDGATPCRHCERRSIECIYAPTKTKAKLSGHEPSSSGKASDDTVTLQSMKADSARERRSRPRLRSEQNHQISPVAPMVLPVQPSSVRERHLSASRALTAHCLDPSLRYVGSEYGFKVVIFVGPE